MMIPVVYLSLESFCYCGSIGASHYWGTLIYEEKGQNKFHKLEITLTQAQADTLNIKDRNEPGCIAAWKAGDIVHRMNSESEVIAEGKRVWKSIFPNAVVLIKGSHCVLDPQRVIDGSAELMKAANKLFQASVKIDGWENKGKEKEMQAICDKWDALFRLPPVKSVVE